MIDPAEPRAPAALADALAALPVRVSAVRCEVQPVAMADYPGGVRPSALVLAAGGGHIGRGEHVAFTDAEHDELAARASRLFPGEGQGTVGALVPAGLTPHARAAIEAALIDLGLRQAGLGLAQLAGAPPRARFRWVASFEACDDPLARLVALRARLGDPQLAFKLDVDPAWSDGVLAALARERGAIATLDLKERGDAALVARLAAAFPDAAIEDPPPGVRARRLARDRPLVDLPAVRAAIAEGAALNLKAPRMGGFLAVLRALAEARAAGVPAYFGGMHEVGPGREQSRQLAALYCADAPNDLAPLAGGRTATSGPSPSEIALGPPGFGATI